MKKHNIITYYCAFCFLLSPHPLLAEGESVAWINPGGGNFSDPENWDRHRVPAPEDTALFGSQASGYYTVSFSEEVTTVDRIEVRGGVGREITFDMGGNKVQLGGRPVAWNEAAIEMRTTIEGGLFKLILVNGQMDAPGFITIGAAGSTSDPDGSIFIVGRGATLVTSGGGRVGNAMVQQGSIRVVDGGQWKSAITSTHSAYWWTVGRSAETGGSIVVEGAGSVIDFNAAEDEFDATAITLILGGEGTGTLEASNGGHAVGAGSISLGQAASEAKGILRVTGQGSLVTAETFTFGGTMIGRADDRGPQGNALVQVIDGGRLESLEANLTEVFGKARVEVGNGGSASFSGPMNWHPGATLAVILSNSEAVPISAGGNLRLHEEYDRGGVRLEVSLAPGFRASVGDTVELFQYDEMLEGFFNDLPQESVLQVGSYTFRIDYGFGTQDRIYLEVTGAP